GEALRTPSEAHGAPTPSEGRGHYGSDAWTPGALVWSRVQGGGPGSRPPRRPGHLLRRRRYGTWTHDFAHAPPHAGGPADAASLAVGADHLGGAGPPRSGDPPHGGGAAHPPALRPGPGKSQPYIPISATGLR